MDDLSKNDRDFFRIATGASIIGMTIVGAAIGSLRGFSFVFSTWTIVGAIIGGVLAWAIWTAARKKAEEAQRRNNQRDAANRPGSA